MSSHQRYLEAPYDRQARLDAAFEAWCDEHDEDYDDDEALTRFEQYIDQFEY